MTLELVPLTPAQRCHIMSVVRGNMDRDDRDPVEVINDPRGPYLGNEDAYLRDMALWHNIDIGAIPTD